MKELSEALLTLELMPEKARHLACNPTAGERYHWSYTATLSLIRCGYPFRLIEPLLAHYRGRPDNWPGELRSQIQNARDKVLAGGPTKAAIPLVSFGPRDAEQVWGWLKEGRSLQALKDASPSNPRQPTEVILRTLFPNDPFICATLGSRGTQVAGRLSDHTPNFLRDCSFIVANPMRTSEEKRCDENIADRRFFVLELDITSDHPAWTNVLAEAKHAGFTVRDLCAAALLFMSTSYPLVLVVDSGGKSLHGWFYAPAIADHNEFCTKARKCGADRRICVPSQLWRMPWGTRRDKQTEKQRVGKQPTIYLSNDYEIVGTSRGDSSGN
jgi:hypothetical protein